MRPDERLDRNRTGSMGSRVGPAVTSTRTTRKAKAAPLQGKMEPRRVLSFPLIPPLFPVVTTQVSAPAPARTPSSIYCGGVDLYLLHSLLGQESNRLIFTCL